VSIEVDTVKAFHVSLSELTRAMARSIYGFSSPVLCARLRRYLKEKADPVGASESSYLSSTGHVPVVATVSAKKKIPQDSVINSTSALIFRHAATLKEHLSPSAFERQYRSSRSLISGHITTIHFIRASRCEHLNSSFI
jgi:hypothetical protein